MFSPDDDHTPACNMVGHFVIEGWPFPLILKPRDLVKDASAEHGYRLPIKWRLWKLVERPGHPDQYARVRTLCRPCIVEELGIAARVKEYDQARKRYSQRGKPVDSFATAVAMQDFF